MPNLDPFTVGLGLFVALGLGIAGYFAYNLTRPTVTRKARVTGKHKTAGKSTATCTFEFGDGTRAARITEALFGGQKVQAIGLYRECTGAGLIEAKAAVERLEAELRAAEPDRFAGPAGGQAPGPSVRPYPTKGFTHVRRPRP